MAAWAIPVMRTLCTSAISALLALAASGMVHAQSPLQPADPPPGETPPGETGAGETGPEIGDETPILPIGPSLTDRCAPTGLFRATIRNISPGLAASARGAQPRQIWRQGATHLRSEEQPDPVRGDQTVVVVAEPDIWIVNLATREGRHTLDPGPVLEVRAPILPATPDLSPTFRALEYGCEAQFVARHAPEPERTIAWGATRATLHTVAVGDQSVAFLMDLGRERPLMISYQRGGRPTFVLRYDDYRLGLPERPQLFAPPKNAKITPGPAGPPPLPLPVDP